MKKILAALVGSPNCGKTTLFNTLTGSRQKTGNYAGVTVEKKMGTVSGHNIELIDLPGLYSLSPQSPDERITVDVIEGTKAGEKRPDVVVAVADGTCLARQLYLVTELRERGLPVILAITMGDLAEKSGVAINHNKLSQLLGLPVIVVSSVTGHGIDELLKTIEKSVIPSSTLSNHIPKLVTTPNTPEFIQARYRFVDDLVRQSVGRVNAAKVLSRKIDRYALHPVMGPAIMLFSFALMFQALFVGAEWPTRQIEFAIAKLSDIISLHMPDTILKEILVEGVISGVGSVLVFLPQILLLFLFIFIFEGSGYLARAAFLLDQFMARFGLNGRAFIPLLSSFACAVPGIMSTRVLDNKNDRLLTIMISPLMTCSARLPVYALLVAAFIPPISIVGWLSLQGLVLFSLYVGAIIIALLISLIFSKTILKSNSSVVMLELPDYKWPQTRNILIGLWDRAWIFIKRAGTIILALSILLWALAKYPATEYPQDSSQSLTAEQMAAHQLEGSFLGRAGKFIEPLVSPLGYDWKLGVAILSSFAAREVMVSTLATIFAVESQSNETDNTALVQRLRSATKPDGQTALFNLPTVLSLLVFFMLACQCISTLAIVKRETNSWRWPAFMFGYMSVLAYVMAFITYRVSSYFL